MHSVTRCLRPRQRPQVRSRYENVLEEVNRYAPRYMEEMESIFDQSQEEERKRIAFLKQTFLSIHKHLDVTTNDRSAGKDPQPQLGCLLRVQLVLLGSVAA